MEFEEIMRSNQCTVRAVPSTFIAVLAASAGGALAGPVITFTPLGQSTGQNVGLALSSNGTQVAGQYADGSQWHWSAATGFKPVPHLPGGSNNSQPADVSNTGVVVGFSNGANGTEAYRWTASGGTVGLGNFQSNLAFYSEATGVSDDGQLISGTGLDNVANRSFRYDGSLHALGSFPGTNFDGNYAHGISADGSRVIGHGFNATGHFEGYTWTQATGIVGIGGVGLENSSAEVISPNGLIIGGATWNDADIHPSAFVRIGSTDYVIPPLDFDAEVYLYDVSNSGAAVGQVFADDPLPEAFLWTADAGAIPFDDYLVGVPEAAGWHFAYATGISADGRTILIAGTNPDGLYETALVTITAPCYANCDASTTPPVVNTGDFTCFLQQYSAAQPLASAQQQAHYANCDGSTTFPQVNTADFTCFLQKYAAGCG